MKRYFIILVLLLTGISFFLLYKKELKEKQRIENNLNIVTNNLNEAIFLHNTELNKYFKQIDSLRSALKIRSKEVQTVFVTKYNYKDSTIILPYKDTIIIKDTLTYTLKEYNIARQCYSLKIKQTGDTIAEQLDYRDKLTGFLYWERPYKFLFIRWGRKQYRLKIASECSNKIFTPEKLIISQ